MIDANKRIETTVEEAEAMQEIAGFIRQNNIQKAIAVWAEWDWISPRSIGRPQGIDYRGKQNEAQMNLVRRIMDKMPNESGINISVLTLLGIAICTKERNVVTASRYEQEITSYRSNNAVAGVQVHQGRGECRAAKWLAGCYLLSDTPELPDSECNEETGCTCWWTCIFEDETPASPWKFSR